MYQTECQMYSPIANDAWKICWAQAKANAQTVCNHHVIILPRPIFGCFFNATIHCSDFQSVRQSHFTGSCCGYHEFARQFGQRHFYVFGAFHWETTCLFGNVIGCVSVRFDRYHLRIHVLTKWLHFIRSIASTIGKSNSHTWSMRLHEPKIDSVASTVSIGEQESNLYSIGEFAAVEFLLILWFCRNALDVFERIVPIQVSLCGFKRLLMLSNTFLDLN